MATDGAAADPPRGSVAGGRLPALAAVLVALSFVGLVAWARVHFALRDTEFDVESPHGLLRSDPGLLYYLTERIVEAGGAVPPDFRADPNIRHPDTADVPAMFTVGQEFLVAWAYLLFGGDAPLHLFALKVMALVAALAAAGVFGLTWELARGSPAGQDARPWRAVGWASAATALFVLQPFSYRTMGVILIREDLSLPLYVGHLWLLARALRTGGWPSLVGSALCLTGALATWHAMGFVVTLEVIVLTGWVLRTGRSPFEHARLALVPAAVALGCLVIPVLRAKLFLFSPAAVLTAGLLAAGLPRPAASRARGALRLVGGAAAWFLVGWVLRTQVIEDPGDYGHVFDFLVAKVTHLGVLPEDPAALEFGTRLLWQGPFATASLTAVRAGLASATLLGLLAVVLALPGWLRGEGDRGWLLLAGLVAAALVSGWLVQRTLVLVAMLAPVAAAAWFARRGRRRLGTAVLGLCLVGQLWFDFRIADRLWVSWYHDGRFAHVDGPDGRNLALRRLIRWARAELPSGEPVLADFVYSTSLLAGAGHPMVLQPKYETRESRDRIEDFFTTVHLGSLESLAALMHRWQVRVLVVAPGEMMGSGAHHAGVRMDRPPSRKSPAFHLCSPSPRLYARVPGFDLIYTSPVRHRGIQLFRVWRLE